MITATDTLDPKNKITDAAVLAVHWNAVSRPLYYAVPAGNADAIARDLLDRSVADRIERVPESELAGKWIGIVRRTTHKVVTWGRAEITVTEEH